MYEPGKSRFLRQDIIINSADIVLKYASELWIFLFKLNGSNLCNFIIIHIKCISRAIFFPMCRNYNSFSIQMRINTLMNINRYERVFISIRIVIEPVVFLRTNPTMEEWEGRRKLHIIDLVVALKIKLWKSARFDGLFGAYLTFFRNLITSVAGLFAKIAKRPTEMGFQRDKSEWSKSNVNFIDTHSRFIAAMRNIRFLILP